MKKMLPLFLFLLSIEGFSQYGYLGKKLSISYSFSTSVCRTYGFSSGLHAQIPGVVLFEKAKEMRRMIFAHHFDMGYTLSRQWEIVALGTIRPINYAAVDYTLSTRTYVPLNNKLPAIETYIDIGFRKYIRGAISPIGGYFVFGFGKASVSTMIKGDSLYFKRTTQSGQITSLPVHNTTWSNYKIITGLGIKKNFNDRFFYQFEGILNIALSQPNARDSGDSSSASREGFQYIDQLVKEQLYIYQSFLAKAGVGMFIDKSPDTKKGAKKSVE